ncbi:ABC transporter ATP-binding protein [Furfurilactobacillus curtus]|uniref:Sodium ABC transporter ATP-binding protein n=1 Tax=Furfurilactobacillus curtus TaxID=1746200 RepID=A0ABQ5JR67_9LACO
MLKVSHLTKQFGQNRGVTDESFTIADGQIMGLIGQNGAGKTTTFRMILNLLPEDSGTVLWNGHPLTPADYNTVGFLPEERGLYTQMTIQEQVVYFAALRGQAAGITKQKLPQWMDRFNVKGNLTDKIKDLSKGNQQKVQLIATLIHEPKLIILDEPFSGLDPVNAQLLENSILQMKQQGASIIFSSHDMANVERVSDTLLMLRNGNTVLQGTPISIREQFGNTRLRLRSPLTKEQLATFPGVTHITSQGNALYLTLAEESVGKKIFTAATAQGYIPEFSQEPPTLDEIFRIEAGATQ